MITPVFVKNDYYVKRNQKKVSIVYAIMEWMHSR